MIAIASSVTISLDWDWHVTQFVKQNVAVLPIQKVYKTEFCNICLTVLRQVVIKHELKVEFCDKRHIYQEH